MKNTNNAIVMTSIIAGVILVVALAVLLVFKPVSSGNTVSVEGVATVSAMPDLISVYFNVETKGDTSSEAKDLNAEILEDVLVALVLEGFERKDIVTENFNIYQDYDWTEEGREEKGFVATHMVKVELEIDEVDKIGVVIDAGVDAGAKINYINFELTQESQNKYKAEAMKLAAEDARVKAEAVAEGFDKDVGKLVSVNIDDFGYYPWPVYADSGIPMMEGASFAKEAATNIQPGEKEVRATVSAVYKLR